MSLMGDKIYKHKYMHTNLKLLPPAVVNPFLLFDFMGLYRNTLCPNGCETIPG